jgi:hypothetical protein
MIRKAPSKVVTTDAGQGAAELLRPGIFPTRGEGSLCAARRGLAKTLTHRALPVSQTWRERLDKSNRSRREARGLSYAFLDREKISWSKKLNLLWWFGNDSEQTVLQPGFETSGWAYSGSQL